VEKACSQANIAKSVPQGLKPWLILLAHLSGLKPRPTDPGLLVPAYHPMEFCRSRFGSLVAQIGTPSPLECGEVKIACKLEWMPHQLAAKSNGGEILWQIK
jgi:hypothetical protein